MSSVVRPGVLDRGEAAVERQLERIAEQPPADVGLADAGDARAPFDDVVLVHDRHSPGSASGSNNGM